MKTISNRSVIAFILMSFFVTGSYANTLKKHTNKTSPTVSLKDLKNKLHTLDIHKDKVVMVQFWATYCIPCRTEMPSMNKLQNELDPKSFKILAINMGEDLADVQQFVDEVKPEFTILLDPEGDHITKWQAFAIPATFIIGRSGNIEYSLLGVAEWDSAEIVTQLQNLIAQK